MYFIGGSWITHSSGQGTYFEFRDYYWWCWGGHLWCQDALQVTKAKAKWDLENEEDKLIYYVL